MVGSTSDVLYAGIVFIGIHVLSSTPLRATVVRRLGEGAFLGLFSLFSALTLGWMIWAWSAAPFESLWVPPLWTRWVTVVLMVPAIFLIVASLTGANPSMTGREGELAALNTSDGAGGILTITRHPLFCGIALFSVAHLLSNGDAASTWLFGALAVLAIAGMPLQDRKKAEGGNAAWGPFALRTSAIPFAAVLQGRTKIDWGGIGWWRPALALAVWAGLFAVHPLLFGVSPLG